MRVSCAYACALRNARPFVMPRENSEPTAPYTLGARASRECWGEKPSPCPGENGENARTSWRINADVAREFVSTQALQSGCRGRALADMRDAHQIASASRTRRPHVSKVLRPPERPYDLIHLLRGLDASAGGDARVAEVLALPRLQPVRHYRRVVGHLFLLAARMIISTCGRTCANRRRHSTRCLFSGHFGRDRNGSANPISQLRA